MVKGCLEKRERGEELGFQCVAYDSSGNGKQFKVYIWKEADTKEW